MIAEVAEREAAKHKATLAAETPPKTDPPPAAAKPDADPFMARLFADTGHVIGEDGALAAIDKPTNGEPNPNFMVQPMQSLMDRGAELKDKPAAAEPKPEDSGKAPEGDPAAQAAETTEEAVKDPKTPETPPSASNPTAPEKKVEVAKEPPLEKIVKETVEKALEGRKTETPAAPPSTATTTTNQTAQDEEYEAGLEEEQREELELARFAAQKNPERYKDLPRQILSYFRAADTEYDRLRAANAETADAEIKTWTEENKPQGLTYRERKQLIETRAEEKVLSKTEKMLQEKTDRYERELHELRVKPAIEKSIDVFRNQTRESMALPEQPGAELAERAKEVGWEKAIDEDVIEGPIVRQVHKNAEALARAYMEMVTGMTQFDPDNAVHNSVLDFVVQDGRRFAEGGGDERVREIAGVKRTFLPRDQFIALQAKDANKAQQEHWTFQDHEILTRLAEDAARAANLYVTQKRQELEKAGYKREKTKAAPKKEATTAKTTTAPAKESSSPKSAPSAAPGAASAPGITVPTGMDDREMNLLVPGWKK